jgi:hypothetical protein
MTNRYTGVIDAPEITHATFIGFDTKEDGYVFLRAFAEAHPGTTPVMYVGEPGDPDDSARFIVTRNEDGSLAWRVPAPGEKVFA